MKNFALIVLSVAILGIALTGCQKPASPPLGAALGSNINNLPNPTNTPIAGLTPIPTPNPNPVPGATSTPVFSATPAPSPVSSSTASPIPSPSSSPISSPPSVNLDNEESAFLALINNFRAQNGAGALQVSPSLEQSSTWMSNDMASKNYFSHTDSLGRAPDARMVAFGYTYFPWGENIAAGSSDAQSAFNQWLNACDPDSSGSCTYAHRMNMLNASFKVIGIGRAYGATSAYKWYWTTDFGGVVGP